MKKVVLRILCILFFISCILTLLIGCQQETLREVTVSENISEPVVEPQPPENETVLGDSKGNVFHSWG